MNIKKLKEQYFVFSSNRNNPISFFQGYCFIGMDYVFGDGGRKKLYEEKGTKINGGEDGCYVIAENTANNFSFSSDFSGNKKIFYYWIPGYWVVSNSIYLIIEELKKNKRLVSVNYSQLFTISCNRSFYRFFL